MSLRAMIFLIISFVVVMFCPVHGSLQITYHEYPLMHYTKPISQEHFNDGRSTAIVLPLAEDASTNRGVRYLIEELHASVRWPVLVHNVSYKMNGNMYTQIHHHDSYIMLVSGFCEQREEHV
jgi:hypothetical protein